MKIVNLVCSILLLLINVFSIQYAFKLWGQCQRLAERGVQGLDVMGVRLPLTMLLISYVFIIPAIIVLFPKFHKSIFLLIINILGLIYIFGVLSIILQPPR